LTSKTYRKITQPPSLKLPILSPRKWSFFWSLPLHHQARNIWFRALHQTLPFKSKLHQFNPEYFVSNLCRCCSNSIETIEHFIYECPLKYSVWLSIWNEYFPPNSNFHTLNDVIFKLTLSASTTSSILPSGAIISCILLGIWRAHWRTIFDDTPFVPDLISTNIPISCQVIPTRTPTCFQLSSSTNS
ncbi:hypothetical protein BDB01DRAFT_731567, partial [Pilobolus umbonatus]